MRDPSAIRWLRSTVEMESSCTQASRWMVAASSSFVPFRARGASPGAAVTRRRISARLTTVPNFATFVLDQLPPPPRRVLEIGCGREGGLVELLAARGYDVLGVD